MQGYAQQAVQTIVKRILCMCVVQVWSKESEDVHSSSKDIIRTLVHPESQEWMVLGQRPATAEAIRAPDETVCELTDRCLGHSLWAEALSILPRFFQLPEGHTRGSILARLPGCLAAMQVAEAGK